MNQPSCSSVQLMVPDALMGGLDEGMRASVLRHAGECDECARALHWQERIHTAVESAPLAEAPSLYYESVLAEIHRRLPAAARRRARPPRQIRREAVGTLFGAAMFCVWFGAHVAPSLAWERLEKKIAGRAATISPEARIAAASRVETAPVVLIEGVGFVSAESGLWDLPDDFLREILPVLPAMIP